MTQRAPVVLLLDVDNTLLAAGHAGTPKAVSEST